MATHHDIVYAAAGTALDFDGTNDYVNLNSTILSGSYTKEAWVYARNSSCRNILSGNNSNTFWVTSNKLMAGYGTTYGHVQESGTFALNIWTHVAVTYNASTGQMNLYKNGTLVGSQSGAGGYSNVLLQIGAHGGGCTWNGLIDEVRIWRVVRTQAEIQASMNYSLTGTESGLEAYYRFDDGAGSSTLADATGHGHIGTLVNMTPASDWVVSGAPISDPPPNPVATDNNYTVLEDTSLAGNVITDDTGNGVDSSPNGSALTAALVQNVTAGNLTLNNNGSFSYTPPANYNGVTTFTYQAVGDGAGKAILLDGVNEYGTAAHHASLNLTALTIEAWIKPNPVGSTWDTIVMKGSYGYGLAIVGSECGGAPPNRLAFWKNPLCSSSAFSTGTITPGVWQHVAVTVDGTGTKFYINGAAAGSTADTTILNNTGLLYLSRQGTCNCNFFNGEMDELRIWNIARSQAAIQATMNQALAGNEAGLAAYYAINDGAGSNSLTDSSTNDNTVTMVNFEPASDWVNSSIALTGLTSNTATVTINVTSQNDPPTAVNDSVSVNEDDGAAEVTAALLANDSDPDNDTLAITAVDTTGTIGTVTLTTAANASVTFVGADYTTNDAWRSSSTAKALDIDGNNIYGSDGFYLFSGGTHTRTSPPAYATVAMRPGIIQYNGNASYIYFDNPDLTGPGPIANVITGVWYSQPGTNNPSTWLDISFSQAGTYRVGIVTDNADFAAISPLDFRLIQVTGGSIDTGYISASADRDRDIDYYFFDISAKVGDVFRLSGRNDGGHGSNGIAGILFDTVTAAAGGHVSYDPNGQFEYLAVGETTTDTFGYTVDDDQGGSDAAVVTVTVTGQNDPPTAVDDSYTVTEDSTTLLDVLASDSDIDTNDVLTITAVDTPDSGGTAVVNGSNISYTPAANFIGAEMFTYTISDGHGGSDSATVTVTVADQNDPPTANNDSYTVNEDSGLTTLNVLANDNTLPDTGETLTITAVGTPNQGGTVINNGTNVSYRPATNFFGLETFTYTISDGNGGTDSATVSVTINPQNDPPTANNDSYTVNEDSLTNNLTVLANDSTAPDTGESLTIVSVGIPNQGGATALSGMTAIHYTPAPNFFGTEAFTYTISDGHGGFDTATVTVTVNPLNDNPTAVDDYYNFPGSTSTVSLAVLTNDLIAPDINETLSLMAVGVPDNGGMAVPNGNTIDYTPLPGFASTETFTYTIADNNGGVATALVAVTIDDNRPNLFISAIQLNHNLVCRGEEVLVQFSLSNPGNGHAGTHAIAFYDDAQAADFLNRIGLLNMQGLPSGNTFNFNVAYIPTTIGTRYFKVFADAQNAVTESVEVDNGAAAALTVLNDPAPSGSFTINNGATYTKSPLITLNLSAEDSGSCASSVAQMRFSINGQVTPWEAYAPTKQLALAALNGEKVTVYAQFRDENNNTSNFIGQSIILDTAAPQTTVNAPSGNTTATSFDVQWSGTDIGSGLQRYDVQVNVNGGGWAAWQTNTTATSAQFANAILGQTYCFRSRGLDAAGNQELYPAGQGDSCVMVQEVSSGADLHVVNVEYTQAIQNASNSVPLVAGRPLLVRVEVGLGTNKQPINGVTAELHAFRNGQALPGSPLRPLNAPLTVRPNPDRISNTDLLHFQLPTAWLTDTIQLYIALDPDAAIGESDEGNNRFPANDFETLAFNKTADLEIVVVPIIWQKDGQTHTVSPADIASFYDYIVRTYPIANVTLKVHNAHRYTGSSIQWVPLLNEIKAIRTAELPLPAPHQKYYGLIPFPYTSYSGTAGVGYRPGKDAIGFAINGDTQGIIAAHEIAHTFGRQHVASTDPGCGVPATPDLHYPYAAGRLNYTGWDFGKDAFLPETYHDFMSYCANVWISDYTYQAIFNTLQTVPQALDYRGKLVSNPAGILVNGRLAKDGSVGELSSAFVLSQTQSLQISGGGDFRLALVNSANIEVYIQAFDPEEVTEEALNDGHSDFSFLLPALDDIQAVRLYYQNSLLDEFTTAAATPAVAITAAVPAVLSGQNLTLTWQSTVAKARYIVRFSPDNGRTWQMVMPPRNATTFTVDLQTLPGTAAGLFEVVANNELATGSARTAAFQVPAKAPEVLILKPQSGRQYTTAGEVVILMGSGYDLEDGALTDSQFTWLSDRDGLIGHGRLLATPNLSPGQHTITLQVTDSDNQTTTTMTTIQIGFSTFLPIVIH